MPKNVSIPDYGALMAALSELQSSAEIRGFDESKDGRQLKKHLDSFQKRVEKLEQARQKEKVECEFTQRRQEIMTNLQSSLTEMEDDYNQIANLTETLHRDRKTKTKVKQESDELAAEIALKSAQKDILDKNLDEVSKRIEKNEKTLESAQNRIKSFEVTYKKEEEGANQEEAAGKVGEYECPICKEICGNEQKHMVCITSCGHRFCKDCIDRVLAPQDHDALAGRLNRLDRRVRGDVQRRCPTCQKHFSKKHVIRLY